MSELSALIISVIARCVMEGIRNVNARWNALLQVCGGKRCSPVEMYSASWVVECVLWNACGEQLRVTHYEFS